MGKLAIETSGLKKSFGKTHAVAGVDLSVSTGGVYGVLGPNGGRKEVQVTEGAAHVTQSWSTCSDGDDHASRNGEKQ